MSFIKNAAFGMGLLMAVGCKSIPLPSTDPTPPTPIPRMTADIVWGLISAAQAVDTTMLRTLGTARAEMGGKSYTLRYDVRTAYDTLFWMDISDPLLGIKVLRAQIKPDTALAFSRLQQIWAGESPQKLASSVGIPFDFHMLFSLWYGRPLYIPTMEQRIHSSLDIQSDRWILSSDVEGSGRFSIEVSTDFPYRVLSQRVEHPSGTVRVEYPNASEIWIHSESGSSPLKIEMQHNEQIREKALHFPFEIPSGFARIRP